MLGDIFSAISLGRKLIETISDLRRDIQSVRSGAVRKDVHSGRLDALESRLGEPTRKPKSRTPAEPHWSKV